MSLVLEQILGSKVKTRVLRLLARQPEREFTLQEVALLTGLSHGSLHPALRRLSEVRAITARRVGRSTVYGLNRRHYLVPPIQVLFRQEARGLAVVAGRFVRDLDKRGIRLILLFGSAARGEASERSDVDLLVVTASAQARARVSAEAAALLQRTDTHVSLTFLTPREARERTRRLDPFLVTALDEGRRLWGDTRWLGR